MRITLTTRHFKKDEAVESFFDERVDKLMMHLTNFKEDAIFIHCNLDRNPHKPEFYASLNVYLPTGTLHARDNAGDLNGAIISVFNSVIRQAEKIKAKLRRSYRRGKDEDKFDNDKMFDKF